MPTKQETFDTVARHLLTQGMPAMNDDGTCMYRGNGDLMCAVGCLIPDDLYDPEIEEKVVGYSAVDRIVGGRLGHDLVLCKALQTLHDGAESRWYRDAVIPYWTRGLRNIAAEFGLSTETLEKIVAELP